VEWLSPNVLLSSYGICVCGSKGKVVVISVDLNLLQCLHCKSVSDATSHIKVGILAGTLAFFQRDQGQSCCNRKAKGRGKATGQYIVVSLCGPLYGIIPMNDGTRSR
jgi:hypothetical protein